MSYQERTRVVQQLVKSINAGDLDGIESAIDRNFFNHSPSAEEETAPEVTRRILSDLREAIPDLNITVTDFTEEEDLLTFTMTWEGTHSGNLWGSPGTGKPISWTSRLTSRFTDGQFAFEWRDLSVPSIISTMRQVGLVPPPEDMDKPPKYPVSAPDFLLKLVFTGQAADKACAHLDQIRVVETDKKVCEDCVVSGDIWPALRLCLICGYVGCCDTSKNKHMKQHYEQTGHPIFRSIRLDEGWIWCYEDDAFFTKEKLEQYR